MQIVYYVIVKSPTPDDESPTETHFDWRLIDFVLFLSRAVRYTRDNNNY